MFEPTGNGLEELGVGVFICVSVCWCEGGKSSCEEMHFFGGRTAAAASKG